MADFRKAGEILSEYSNAWIDMRHDNARRFGRMGSVRLERRQLLPVDIKSAAAGRRRTAG